MSAVSHRSVPNDVAHTSLPARVGMFAYGLFAYLCFFAAFVYAVGFVGNWLVPKSIDSGAAGPVIQSIVINACLLMVFVLQHTIMARPAFKRWVTRFVSPRIERSTFVIAASASLGLVYWQWQPAPQVVWDVGRGAAFWALTVLSLSGYLLVFLSSWMVSHFDLFGLRQAWFALMDKPYIAVGFRLVGLYKLVRHPLMLGFLIAFWSTPVMTIGHLAFSVLVTSYIFVGIWFEERDLVTEHGRSYVDYRRSVRALIPIPRKGDL